MDPQHHHRRKKDKLVVIMGATGAGKSRLSIDLATHFPPSSASFEIINSDKIQLYKGLDITTNKIPLPERLGVPHHLLGELDGEEIHEISVIEFRRLASRAVSSIISRRRIPMLVGGSNSLIYSLLVEPNVNVFETGAEMTSSELRYDCCFLWVDVSFVVLAEYLSKRVDQMLETGMYEELAEFCATSEEDNDDDVARTGLRKAIGVPEFSRFFKQFPLAAGRFDHDDYQMRREAAYDEAVKAVKDNTCQLAKKQVGKIMRLKGLGGWDLRRVDATEAFRAVVKEEERKWSEIWEEQVVQPSLMIVKQFLDKE